MKLYYTVILLFFIFLVSCNEDNTTNQLLTEEPVYTHSLIELSGPGLIEYHDTIPLIISGTDSIYTEFWSETNIDSSDYLLLSVNVLDTAGLNVYSSGFYTENSGILNNVHGFGFKMTNESVSLQIIAFKGSLGDRFLRIRNLKIFKK